VDDRIPVEIFHEVEDILPDPRNLPVLTLGDIECQDMKLAPVIGKIGGDLLTDKGVLQVCDLEGSLNTVMVRDGYEIHAPVLGDPVKVEGLGVALGAADLSEKPLRRPSGVF
jgi:hypothetical protein